MRLSCRSSLSFQVSARSATSTSSTSSRYPYPSSPSFVPLRIVLSRIRISRIALIHRSNSRLYSFTFEPFLHAKCTTIFWSKGNRTQPLPFKPRHISMLLLPAVAGLSQLRFVQVRYRALVATPRLPKLQTIRENTASTSVPTSQPQGIQLG